MTYSFSPGKYIILLIIYAILDVSAAVLEDDSGIPYKYFDKTKWDFQLFGKYDHPYGGFHKMVQPTLKADILKPEAKPLDFPIGYGYRAIPSNLILAVKKPVVVSAATSAKTTAN